MTADDSNGPNIAQPGPGGAKTKLGRAASNARRLFGGAARPGSLGSLSLASKLLLMLLLTSLASIAVVGWLAASNGRRTLEAAAQSQLISLRHGKKQQIEWYFQNLRDSFQVYGQDSAINTALRDFTAAFEQIDTIPLPTERISALESYYRSKFLPALKAVSATEPALENFWTKSNGTLQLQSLFILDNPEPRGNRINFTLHPSSNAYTRAHVKHHPFLSTIAKKLKFKDLFLIEGQTGTIVYSAAKEPDFGTNLNSGPYARTSLGRLYRQVVQEHKPGYIKMTDFEAYPASLMEPAAFIGVPVFDNNEISGVLIAEISNSAINTFLTNGRSWKQNGLGATGEIYLVGADRLMRTDSRFLLEQPKAFIEKLKSRNQPTELIKAIEKQNTTVLLFDVRTEGTAAALRGEAGIKAFRDYRGIPVLSAYTPLDIPDLRWVLMAEMDSAEIEAPQNAFLRNILIATCLLAILTALSSMLLASRFLRPVTTLLDGIARLRAGERDVTIETARTDEFGQLAVAFNDMSRQVQDRDAIINSKSSAYEQLLKRIFPDIVAQKLRDGEVETAQSFPNVTVMYLSITGFVQQAELLGPRRSIEILNDIVDAFDHTAQSAGIEKIKTIGEHYLACCGLNAPRLDHARRALEFVEAGARDVERIGAQHGIKLGLRAGLCSGTVSAGLVGNLRFVYDVWGRPLNVARRLAQAADIDEVRLDTSTYGLLADPERFGDKLTLESRTFGSLETYAARLHALIDDTNTKNTNGLHTKQAGGEAR